MSTGRYYADIYVYLHGGWPQENRGKMAQCLRGLSGVFSTHFDADTMRDAMYVSYDPGTVTSDSLLDTIRGYFPGAVKAAKILIRVSD